MEATATQNAISEIDHTPLPWNWHEQGEANEYCLLTNDKRWVLAFRQNGEIWTKEQKANAEFIVRACNSHDAMLDALDEITDALLYGMGKEAIQLRVELCLQAISKARDVTHKSNIKFEGYKVITPSKLS